MQQVVSLADRKRKLINFLKDKTYIRIGLSPRGGVGIIGQSYSSHCFSLLFNKYAHLLLPFLLLNVATQEIPMNINPFVTNVDPSNSETIDLMKSEIDRLPMHVRDIITHFIIPHVEGGTYIDIRILSGLSQCSMAWRGMASTSIMILFCTILHCLL